MQYKHLYTSDVVNVLFLSWSFIVKKFKNENRKWNIVKTVKPECKGHKCMFTVVSKTTAIIISIRVIFNI